MMKNLVNYRMTARYLYLLNLIAVILLTQSCLNPGKDHDTQQAILQEGHDQITEQEVLDAQMEWGQGIVAIGMIYLENGDYAAAALEHINQFYAYEMGPVFFKPTLASKKAFRTELTGALSYFVGGNADYPEDHGFAIKPWKDVRWENIGVKVIGNVAMAMGNYYFIPHNAEEEVKVEYSFVYTRDEEGRLRIILHDSHLPYSPSHD